MVTVIDLTTGTVIYRSRESEPRTITGEPLAGTQTALQPVSRHDAEEHRTSMPPDLADACVDDLLARWEK